MVELPDEAVVVDADGLGELLVGTPSGIPGPARPAQRVRVDDAFFELTLEELVSQSCSDAAVVLQSASHLAGIRSLPAEDGRLAGRELRRLHEALCGQR